MTCARKILKFTATSQAKQIDTSIYSAFVQNNESRVRAAAKMLWPGIERLSHWSGMGVRERVELLGSPFDEICEVHYPRLSWHVHSGLTGVVNLKAETFTVLCAAAFKVAADSYWDLLLAMIREFKIAKANEKIEKKLKAVKLLPFTNTPDEAEQLLRGLLQ